MRATVGRRLLAEFTATGLLVAVVVGSGITASRLTSDSALQLLVNSLITALGLAVLILVFTPAGGAHFNPVVTAPTGFSPGGPTTATASARLPPSSRARSLGLSPEPPWLMPCSPHPSSAHHSTTVVALRSCSARSLPQPGCFC
jgi:hypothetical protein